MPIPIQCVTILLETRHSSLTQDLELTTRNEGRVKRRHAYIVRFSIFFRLKYSAPEQHSIVRASVIIRKFVWQNMIVGRVGRRDENQPYCIHGSPSTA
jgi:hypothetical protein